MNLENLDLKDLFSSQNIFLESEKFSYTYKETSLLIAKASFFLNEKKVKNKVCLSFNDPALYIIFLFAAWNNNLAVIALSAKSPNAEITEKSNGMYILNESIFDFTNFASIHNTLDLSTLTDLTKEALVVFSSGSTSKPKGIRLSFENLFYSALGTIEFYGLENTDSWLLSLPLNHVGGLLIPIRCLLAKAKVVLGIPGNEQIDLLKLKPSFISLVTTQLSKLIDLNKDEINTSLKECKAIILGGAPTPISVLKKACDLKLNLANSYGQTEMCAQITSTVICHDIDILQTVGKTLPYRELDIVNNRITVGGRPLFLGLDGLENRSFSMYETSDLGHFDNNNNLVISGRSDQVFISGGENISPTEIENKIMTIDSISDVYIVACPDQSFGQVAIAYIQYKAGTNISDIKSELKKILHPHHLPKMIIDLNNIPRPQDLGKIKYSKNDLSKYAKLLYRPSSSPFHRITSGNLNGPIVVFFHGFMGSCQSFLPVIKEIEKKYFCISYDLAGHGKTSASNFTSWENHLEKLSLELASLGQNINLIGYSQGGRVASGLLYKTPDLFDCVVLESSSFGIKDQKERQKRYLFDLNLLKDVNSKAQYIDFLDSWYKLPLFGELKKHKDFTLLIDKLLENDLDQLKSAIELLSVGNHPYYLDYLKNLKKKNIHYISGKNDVKYNSLGNDCLESNILKHHIIKSSAHNVHFQKLDIFCKTLLDILP